MGGQFVTFQNYEASEYQIAFQAESQLDVGIELTPTGSDKYATTTSETITLVAPPGFAKSVNLYKVVTEMVKPVTKGRVRMYAYNPNTQVRLLLAVYEPDDVNPWFNKFRIPTRCENNCVTVYAKKKYQEVTKPTDFVDFSIDALIHAVEAITLRLNKGNDQAYQLQLAQAIAEVNRSIADNEMDTGSPMRIFAPDVVDRLNPPWWSGQGQGWGWTGYY